ncbi:Complement receptor type 1, partial [Tinamus guttatus]
YQCRPGYTPASGKHLYTVCQNSTWAWDSNFCIGKNCGPPEIPNGKIDENANFLFGGIVHFSCNTGYRLIGDETAQCILDGTDVVWSQIPHCEIIPCEPPPAIANGQFTADEGSFTFGSTVTYSCHQNFTLIGEPTIYCTSDDNLNGKWSGPAPECKVVRCQNPEVENGEKVSGFGPVYTYKDAVTFQCKSGFLLNGSSVVICEANSTWQPPLPLCDPRSCGAPPSFTFAGLAGAVSSQYVVGTQLTYTCKPGYAAASGKSPVVTCLTNATWSADSKFCTRQQCSTPQIKDGKVLGDSFEFEATVTFTCNPGFKLNGPSSATCEISGNGVGWNKAFPTCEREPLSVSCGPPPTIDHGMHNGGGESSFPYGSVVDYKCHDGFTLIGKASIHCTVEDESHGVWSKPTPQCRGAANKIIAGILPLLLAILVFNF